MLDLKDGKLITIVDHKWAETENYYRNANEKTHYFNGGMVVCETL